MTGFETKDSGKRAEYGSGMVRDTEEGKARFDLILPNGVPYAEQMLTRFADLMARGAEKYAERNWEKARGDEELARYKSSALRHLIQWMTGETDEDHAAAVMFNLLAGETVRYRMRGNAAWAYPHPEAKPVGIVSKDMRRIDWVTCDLDDKPHRLVDGTSNFGCQNPSPWDIC